MSESDNKNERRHRIDMKAIGRMAKAFLSWPFLLAIIIIASIYGRRNDCNQQTASANCGSSHGGGGGHASYSSNSDTMRGGFGGAGEGHAGGGHGGGGE